MFPGIYPLQIIFGQVHSLYVVGLGERHGSMITLDSVEQIDDKRIHSLTHLSNRWYSFALEMTPASTTAFIQAQEGKLIFGAVTSSRLAPTKL